MEYLLLDRCVYERLFLEDREGRKGSRDLPLELERSMTLCMLCGVFVMARTTDLKKWSSTWELGGRCSHETELPLGTSGNEFTDHGWRMADGVYRA